MTAIFYFSWEVFSPLVFLYHGFCSCNEKNDTGSDYGVLETKICFVLASLCLYYDYVAKACTNCDELHRKKAIINKNEACIRSQ